MGCCGLRHYYQFRFTRVPIFQITHKNMGGAAKARRRLTPASCADRINELNAEEQKMMLEMLLKRHKKDMKKIKYLSGYNISETVATDNVAPEHETQISSASVLVPTSSQLRQLALFQAMPFIGFGFLDNFIMIVAGEYIDLHIGATFTISTMAAAALGNTISDVFGIASAWYVEHCSEKLGVRAPLLTLEQLQLTSCRVAGNAGRALGVMLGCIIGMFPLLFIGKDKT